MGETDQKVPFIIGKIRKCVCLKCPVQIYMQDYAPHDNILPF